MSIGTYDKVPTIQSLNNPIVVTCDKTYSQSKPHNLCDMIPGLGSMLVTSWAIFKKAHSLNQNMTSSDWEVKCCVN